MDTLDHRSRRQASARGFKLGLKPPLTIWSRRFHKLSNASASFNVLQRLNLLQRGSGCTRSPRSLSWAAPLASSMRRMDFTECAQLDERARTASMRRPSSALVLRSVPASIQLAIDPTDPNNNFRLALRSTEAATPRAGVPLDEARGNGKRWVAWSWSRSASHRGHTEPEVHSEVLPTSQVGR